jgi:hypothetical protein
MKVLFDCILTGEPRKCSTTIQFYTLANMLLRNPGVFIYWPVPEYVSEQDFEFYPKSDRIKYFRTHQFKDRMKEYNRIPDWLMNMLTFYGSTWDWDVLVTVRTPQVPMMKTVAISPRQMSWGWSKRILVIENMMVLSKKPTVAQSQEEIQDRMTLEGYMASHKTFLPAYHEKKWVREIARKHFSFARVADIDQRIQEVCQLQIIGQPYGLKTVHKYDGKRKLGLVFVGRIERASIRLDLINKLMASQFILFEGQVRTFMCTVTQGDTWIDTDAIEVLHPQREEFWRIAREEMDVALSFSVDVELNLSKLEPLMFGVPLIAQNAPWAIGMLGPDYPFLVSGETQALAMINEFRLNYDQMYERFAQWYNEWFIPEYTRREVEDGLYNQLYSHCMSFGQEIEQLPSSYEENSIVQLIAEHAGEEFVLFDVLRKLDEQNILKTLAKKLDARDSEVRGIVWSTPWNAFRLALQKFHGYEDASTEVGHMRKVAHAQS